MTFMMCKKLKELELFTKAIERLKLPHLMKIHNLLSLIYYSCCYINSNMQLIHQVHLLYRWDIGATNQLNSWIYETVLQGTFGHLHWNGPKNRWRKIIPRPICKRSRKYHKDKFKNFEHLRNPPPLYPQPKRTNQRLLNICILQPFPRATYY